MRVLVGCEYSGLVRESFNAFGHDAWSCDLLDSDIPGKHIKDDLRNHLNDSWDLMIAFPPCTHLAISGASHFYKKEKEQREAIEFVKELMNAPINKICIENPVSVISSKIRKPDQIIQPYYFGSPIQKKTCLWLKNLMPLFYGDNLFYQTTIVQPEFLYYNSKKTKSGLSKYSIFGKLGKGHGHERSITFPGVAQEMARQWGAVETELKQ